MFDFTIRAFNLAEQYRLPVLIMADEVIGHMSERVVIPEPAAIETVERARPTVPRISSCLCRRARPGPAHGLLRRRLPRPRHRAHP